MEEAWKTHLVLGQDNHCTVVRSSGGSWCKWPGGLQNFISGWTYGIVALVIFI